MCFQSLPSAHHAIRHGTQICPFLPQNFINKIPQIPVPIILRPFTFLFVKHLLLLRSFVCADALLNKCEHVFSVVTH